jgi:hypothetical protein
MHDDRLIHVNLNLLESAPTGRTFNATAEKTSVTCAPLEAGREGVRGDEARRTAQGSTWAFKAASQRGGGQRQVPSRRFDRH